MNRDLQKRVIFGALSLAVFLPLVVIGGVAYQLFIGLLAMISTAELLKMNRLSPSSIEGILAMLAALVLTLPLETYLSFLPTDGNYVAFAIVVFLMLGTIVFNIGRYSYSDVVYPIASSFYVGIGFHNLIGARMDSLSKVLFALCIVWATDIGAYMIGRQIGRHKLMPKVSPNKTVEGFVGGILSAVVVAAVYLLVDRQVVGNYSFVVTLSWLLFSPSLPSLVTWWKVPSNGILGSRIQAN